MIKLLWTSNSAGKIGGQNRVSYFTIKELQKIGYEVHCCGNGVQVLDEGEASPCPIYPFHEHEPEKFYQLIDQIKPDLIVFSHDIWKFYFLPELKQKYPHIPLVGWYTIDAHPIHHSWFPLIRATDHNCVSTQFGKKTIYERFPERMTEVIKYGVDSETYNLR